MLRDRARSAAILVPPLLVVLWLGNPWLALVVAVVAALGAREVFRLLGAAGYPSFPALGTVLAVVVAVADAIPSIPAGSGLLMASAGIVLVGTAAITRQDPREGAQSFAVTTFGALYVGLIGFLARLAEVAPTVPSDALLAPLGAARAWILPLVLGVWTFDTAAYLVGRRLGRRPFMAHISPAKTLEGVIGGLVATVVVEMLLVLALGQPALLGAGLGLAVAAAAQAGDLAESMLKRAAGVKDSGSLIPGHGGILDRVDSFLFAAPVVVLYVVIVFR